MARHKKQRTKHRQHVTALVSKKKKKKNDEEIISPADETPCVAFAADPDDHCETPSEAYADVAPALEWLASRCGKTRGTVHLYDPYWCAGGVKSRLGELGFERVANDNVDCYATWDDREYDVLVTNPPYSGDHIARLARYCAVPGCKWLWLVPEWTHKKEEFVAALDGRVPLYLSPEKRYVYAPPPNMRAKKRSDTHKKTAPFHSIWICWAGTQPQTDALASWWKATQRSDGALRVARSRSQLRDLRRRKK
ncbi:hypothetical protein CTAYLR_000505 [Chrysophaeum taylorii]|uniref:Uncharacterized protein n=1 Tax=Chrysophaeum taylorii TaxID=2483200 RepID=A0AAD7UHI6_9STRA|nr:hypothetical protein CTAYLR_000505 [Chrysophaeum taylorii]